MNVNLKYGTDGIGIIRHLHLTDDDGTVCLTGPLDGARFHIRGNSSWLIEYDSEFIVRHGNNDGMFEGDTPLGEHVVIRPYGYEEEDILPEYGADFDEMVLRV